MTRKLCASFLAAVLAVMPSFAADLVSDYTVSGTTYSRSNFWLASDGATIVFKYKNLPQSGTERLVSWSQSDQQSYTGLVGLCSYGGVLKGWWRDGYWSGGTVNTKTLGTEGIIVCVYGPNSDGVTAYNAEGSVIFRASGLRSTGVGVTMGSRFDFSPYVSDVKIYNSAITADEVSTIVNGPTLEPDMWLEGSAIQGWTNTTSGDSGEKTERMIGPNRDVPITYSTYAVSWLPYTDVAAKDAFTVASYINTELMSSSKLAVIWSFGTLAGNSVVLCRTSIGNIRLLTIDKVGIQSLIEVTADKITPGYHLYTASFTAGGNIALMMDGKDATYVTADANLSEVSDGFQIGTIKNNSSSSNFAQGLNLGVADMVGFNRALTKDEMKSLVSDYPATTSYANPIMNNEAMVFYAPSLKNTSTLSVPKGRIVLGVSETVTTGISGSAVIQVNKGVTFDVAKMTDIGTSYQLDVGGTITNSGAAIGTNLMQVASLSLYKGNATVTGNTFGLVAPRWGASTLNFRTYTLNVNMNAGEKFILCNTTFQSGGKLRLESGRLYFVKKLSGTLNLDLPQIPSQGDRLFELEEECDLSALTLNVTVNGEPLPETHTVNGEGVIEVAEEGVISATGALPETTAFSWVPGSAPSGWFTGWGGEAGGNPVVQMIGPNGTVDSIYRVYNEGGNDKWHPWNNLSAKSAYTLSLYGCVDMIETPAKGSYAVLWSMGSKTGQKTVLALNDQRKITLVSANGGTIEKTLVGPAIKGYHLLTVAFDETKGAALVVDAEDAIEDASLTTSAVSGFQVGSVYGGNTTTFDIARGFAVLDMVGYDTLLSMEAISSLTTQYPAVETITETITINQIGESIYLPSITIPDGKQLRVQKGTLIVPAAVEATLGALEFGDINTGDLGFGMELNGTINIVNNKTFTSNDEKTAYDACNAGRGVNFGEWAGVGEFDIRGTFNAPDTVVVVVHDSSKVTINVDGGTVNVKGITAKTAERATINLASGATWTYSEKVSEGNSVTLNEEGEYSIVSDNGAYKLVRQTEEDYVFTETQTVSQSLSGAVSVTVNPCEGGVVTFSAANTFTGGLVVESGTAKTTSATGFGPNNYNSWATPDALGQIEVKDGATLDLANTANTCYAITTAGTITNSGDDIGTGLRQTVKIALSGDATVSGSTFGLLAANHNATQLDLGEHTLTVAMNENKMFILSNTTISNPGTIKLKSGSLWINKDKSFTGTITLDLSEFSKEGGTVATGSAAQLEKIVLAEGQTGWSLNVVGNNLVATYEEPLPEFNPETDTVATNAVLRFSEIMPKPSDKPGSITTEAGYDKNGLESGWVELENTSETEWADLADYKFIRTNRSKANDKGDYGAFPSVKIPPSSKYVFYTSERYSNSASKADSAFAEGTFDGAPMYFEKYGMMIWGDKINPKKFPFVRLYFKDTTIVDTVVIPSDIPEGNSIIVTPVEEGKATVRYMTNKPTKGTANTSLTDASIIKLGPNAGPLYEISTGKKHNSASEFARVAAPAKTNEDYVVTFSMNPTMSPTEVAKFRAEDAITKIDMIVRTDLNDETQTTIPVDLTTKTTDAKDWGDSYTATIPLTLFPKEGHLIQWKFEVTDAAGNTWTTPSFHNPDDGYEWYGTIVESETLTSKTLPTWHMFVDAASKAQMDKDAPQQTLPNQARVAIYDSSTSNYYDYVRIDLRGNTSAHFNKKSHGLRFSKAHPLTMVDIVASEGETIVKREEVRKSSLIGEPADPSRMRQMMAFWLWNKMGNKVPFDFPVRCNLNGDFFQLAFHSERFTDELIEDFHNLDKYGYGYKNVGTLKTGSGTSAGGIEKKTPDDGNESDLTKLENELRKPLADLGIDGLSAKDNAERPAVTKFVVEKFDLPAWLNYLASARITQEMDDVWANISIYCDDPQMLEGTRGTGTWMPLGYDFNLTFGQWYINDVQGAAKNGTYMVNQDWFKSHPFYGGNVVRCYKQEAMTTTCNEGNRAIEAVWQSPKFRRLYLRRLRTLMDQELGAPNTDETLENTTIPVMVRMKEVANLMRADANEDTTKYPWDSSIGNIDIWGQSLFPKTMDAGIAEIWEKYIVPRREHLYVTHAAKGHAAEEIGYGTKLCAGIPAAQSPIVDLKAGLSAEYDSTIGAVIIKNTNAETIDLSGWTLGGPVQMTLPAGTVIDEGSNETPAEVYVTADRRATIAKMKDNIVDQVVVGNGTAGDSEVITLKAGEETVIAPPEPSEQEKYVKLYGFCGQPVEGDDGDGEFIILWNTADHDVDVAGLTISICKSGDLVAKCLVTLPEGTTIPAGTYLRLNHADYPKAVGWDKITNGNVDIKLTDLKGVVIYAIDALSQEALGVKGTGSYAKYDWEANAWGADLIENAPGYVAPEPPPVDPVDPPAEGDITGDFDELQTFATGAYTINGANFNGGVKIDGDVTLTLKGENTLSTMVTAGTLTIEGEGTLTIDYVDGEAGTAAVTLTKPYIQNGGNVVVNLSSENQVFGFYCNTATKDALGNGIYAVELNGGTFTTTIAGGESSAAFKLGKGSNDAKLGGTDVTVTLGGTAPRFINTDGKIKLTKNCGKVTVTTAVEGGTTANVFKSKKEIEINGGTVVATASGEGSEIFSADDTILVKGGVLNLTAADDCFSAANHINVTGGIVYAMSTAGDAIDSNGDMTISGGYVFAFTTSTLHEALDIDPSEDPTVIDNGIAHKLYINEGATVVAVGGLSTVHGPDDGSTAKCLVKTGLSSSSKYLVMTGIVDDENVRRTTTATINWNKKHAKTFTLIATMPGFTGEITEGGDEVKPSTGKLADEISGMFVNTVESSIVTPSGATTWAEVEVTESTTVEELVGSEQAATLAKFEEVTPEVIATWAKVHSTHTKPGEAINLVAFALNCAPNEEAIDAARKNFKVTITMTEEGPVAEIESGFYNVTPVLKGKVELPEENWIEVTEDNKDTLRFFRAFIEIGD